MKRTIGWLVAAMMSAPACGQQSTPPAKAASGGDSSGGNVVIVQEGADQSTGNQPYRVRSGTISAGQAVTGRGGGGSGGGGAFGSTDSGGGVIKEPWPMYYENRSGGGRITVTPGGDGKQLTITTDEQPGFEQYRALQGYLTTIDQYSRSNRDATTTAVAAVMQAAEILKAKGADAEINYFNKVMDSTQNATVRRAIRLQLIDAYKRAGQVDKALDELKTIILEASEKGKEARNY